MELAEIVDCNFFTFNGSVYLAKVVKCYDGDTVHCIFKHDNEYQKFIIRMKGYDSCEMKPKKGVPDRDKIIESAKSAKKKLEDLVLGKCVYLYCDKFDKYGRILGTIKLSESDIISVNDIMIRDGYGVPYNGGTKLQTKLFNKKVNTVDGHEKNVETNGHEKKLTDRNASNDI